MHCVPIYKYIHILSLFTFFITLSIIVKKTNYVKKLNTFEQKKFPNFKDDF